MTLVQYLRPHGRVWTWTGMTATSVLLLLWLLAASCLSTQRPPHVHLSTITDSTQAAALPTKHGLSQRFLQTTTTTNTTTTTTRRTYSSSSSSVASNTNQPDKGDKDNCFGPNGEAVPCLSETFPSEGDGLDPGDPFQDHPDPWNPHLSNHAHVHIFVRLRASGQSIGHALTGVVSTAMNQSLDEHNVVFFLPPHYQEGSENSNSFQGGFWYPPNTSSEIGEVRGHPQNSSAGNLGHRHQRTVRRRLQNGNRRDNERYNMYYTQRNATVLRRGTKAWWWRYTIVYNCFWSNTGDPVNSRVKRASMSRNMTRFVQTERESLRDFLRNLEGDPNLELTENEDVMWMDDLSVMDDPVVVDESGRDDEGRLYPVDTTVWDWYRYLGLALFVTTLSASLLLVQLGSMRRQRRIQKQVWSNLASEEGVKELLKTGWVLKGNQMEVYDRSKVGYSDDNSMLIGGFEQKEAVVGTEISLFITESDKTSTNPRTASSVRPRS